MQDSIYSVLYIQKIVQIYLFELFFNHAIKQNNVKKLLVALLIIEIKMKSTITKSFNKIVPFPSKKKSTNETTRKISYFYPG